VANPYEVLGIPNGASIEDVKRAYRTLAAKYHPSNYEDGPLSEQAARKMDEINRAYDSIVMNSSSQDSYSRTSSYNNYSNNYTQAGFYDIRQKINQGRLDDAQMLLDGIAPSNRTPEWYYLKGLVLQKRGWFEQANDNFSQAYRMDPSNAEYKAAFDNMNRSSRGAYRTDERSHSGGCLGDCGFCDICSGLLCADCCCECMGGDLLPCC